MLCISRSGTVYHDQGNINFTIFRPTGNQLTLDYQTPVQPTLRFPKQSGLAAEFDDSTG